MLPTPPQEGSVGFFRMSKNQKSGKCHELPRNSKKSLNPGGGVEVLGGQKIKKSGKCHELPRKLINFFNPLQGWRGRGGREGGDREGEREAGREGGVRAKPGNQLVINIITHL